MDIEDKFISNAPVIGEKARVVMLWNLLDGKAYTATELAASADISRQSASNHLNKMMDAGLLIVNVQGRHRYYSFANDEVAYAIEALANLIPGFELNKLKKEDKVKKGMFLARTCYDHLAGNIAVKITDAFIDRKFLINKYGQFVVSDKGYEHLSTLGINVDELKIKRRPFIRTCLDWTERRNHMAGALGCELLQFMLRKTWLRKISNSREVMITPIGFLNLAKIWGIEL